jgi:hypothetical protein
LATRCSLNRVRWVSRRVPICTRHVGSGDSSVARRHHVCVIGLADIRLKHACFHSHLVRFNTAPVNVRNAFGSANPFDHVRDNERRRRFAWRLNPLGTSGSSAAPATSGYSRCWCSRKRVSPLHPRCERRSPSTIITGRMPFVEYGAEDLLKCLLPTVRLAATTDPSVVKDAEIVICLIGTPVDEFLTPKMLTFFQITGEISPHLHDEQTLVLRSTVYPGPEPARPRPVPRAQI